MIHGHITGIVLSQENSKLRKRKKDTFCVDFEDVFTGSTYPNYKTNTLECDNGKTVAKIVSPFVSNKRRIKSKNTVLIKK